MSGPWDLSRRGFLKLALASVASAAAAKLGFAAASTRSGFVGDGIALAGLGYYEDARTGINGVRLRWTLPAFRPIPNSDMLEFLGFPEHVSIYRAPLGAEEFKGYVREESTGQAPTIGTRSTIHPDGLWDYGNYNVDFVDVPASKPMFEIVRRSGPAPRAVRVTVDVDGWARYSEENGLDDYRGISTFIERVRVKDEDGNCLMDCPIEPGSIERFDLYCDFVNVHRIELHLNAKAVTSLDASDVGNLVEFVRILALSLDEPRLSLNDEDWVLAAEVYVREPLTVPRGEGALSTDTWCDFSMRLSGRSTQLTSDMSIPGLDERIPGIDQVDAAEWAELLKLARTAQNEFKVFSEHSPAPANTDLLDLNPWDALSVLLADRWEYATLAGFGFLDGPSEQHRNCKASRLDSPFDTLSGRPDDDCAYKVEATYQSQGKVVTIGSNVIIANHAEGRQVLDLEPPYSAQYRVPDDPEQRQQYTSGVPLTIGYLNNFTRGADKSGEADVDKLDAEGPTVFLGEVDLEVDVRHQPHATGVFIAEHVEGRIGAFPEPSTKSRDHASHEDESSEWELTRRYAHSQCHIDDDANIRFGNRFISTDTFSESFRHVFATRRDIAELTARVFATDSWDRMSPRFAEAQKCSELVYWPPSPYIQHAAVTSDRNTLDVTVEAIFAAPSEFGGQTPTADSAATNESPEPSVGVSETGLNVASWLPPSLLSVDGASAELEVVRRLREPVTLEVEVLQRSLPTTFSSGVLVAYEIVFSNETAISNIFGANPPHSFIGGFFAAGRHSGVVKQFHRRDLSATIVVKEAIPDPEDEAVSKSLDFFVSEEVPPEPKLRFAPRLCQDDDPATIGRHVLVYSPPGIGLLSQPVWWEKLWERVDIINDNRSIRAYPLKLDEALPGSITIQDGTRPSRTAELRTYAARIVYYRPANDHRCHDNRANRTENLRFQGHPGNTADLMVLPIPPGETPEFYVENRGLDFYGRLLIEVIFLDPFVSGDFEVAWSPRNAAWQESELKGSPQTPQEPVWFAENALPGLFGRQPLAHASSIFELIDYQGPTVLTNEAPTITVGVRRVDGANQNGKYRLSDEPLRITPSSNRAPKIVDDQDEA